jgi:hypothetical protein
VSEQLEFDVEQDLVTWAEAQGGMALKIKLENQRGFPDRLVILPGNRIVFVELKRPGKSHTYPQQIEWLKRLHACDCNAILTDNVEDVADQVDFGE